MWTILILTLVFGILGAIIGESRGRLLLGPIGMTIVAVLPTRES